jgi:hypothetical protein
MSKQETSWRAVSPDNGKQHWFGYYDVCPWSGDGTKLLCMEADFMDHAPGPDDVARILLLDLAGRETPHVLARTRAWNWQMSCRLQWLPSDPDRLILFNDRREGRFVTVILDVTNGRERVLPLPSYAVSRDGRCAITTSFSRLHDCRPGYGYAGIPDPSAGQAAPEQDGLYRLDLTTGRSRLLFSYAQIVACEHTPDMDIKPLPEQPSSGHAIVPTPDSAIGKHRNNHLLWGPGDRRIMWLHRWVDAQRRTTTRLMTANPDGTGLTCLARPMISHFDWQHPDEIFAWAQPEGHPADYYFFQDLTGRVRPMKAGRFATDGHCSWSPDLAWLLTDGYPDQERNYGPILYRPATDRVERPLTLKHPAGIPADCRCDLHPRWSRDGRHICFDGAPEGRRRLFVADVNAVVADR